MKMVNDGIVSKLNSSSHNTIETIIYYKEEDGDLPKEIPFNLPILQEPSLSLFSVPIDHKIRIGMTKECLKLMAFDRLTGQLAGHLMCSVKLTKIGKVLRTNYYIFGAQVFSQYRKMGLFQRLLQELNIEIDKHHLQFKTENPIVTISFKENLKVVKDGLEQQTFTFFQNQTQYSWSCGNKVKETIYPSHWIIIIWREYNHKATRERWETAFQSFQITPHSFDEILVDNEKFHEYTFMAQLTINGEITAEASISTWNQDLVFTLRNKNTNEIISHRQLYSCYSKGTNTEEIHMLFQVLLERVHNDLCEEGVRFLFLGLSNEDPIRIHFPLVKKYQNIGFRSSVRSIKGPSGFTNSSFTTSPKYNDPRDYGPLCVHLENTNTMSSPLLCSTSNHTSSRLAIPFDSKL